MSTLEGKTALVVGAGGMGGAAALTLAAGGAARIVFVDAAQVETRDLSGHPLLREEDAGRPRAAAAARGLARRFPALEVVAPELDLDGRSGLALVGSADVVVDASNRFATMFAVNDAAAAAGKPLVHGGVLQHTLQILTVVPGETGCIRCLFEAPPPPLPGRGLEADALGALVGFAGALLGSEALRLLEGARGEYAGRLFVYEARSARSRGVTVRRREGCAACGVTAAAAAGGST